MADVAAERAYRAGQHSAHEIARAVPSASFRARGQSEWLRGVMADMSAQEWRRDRAENWSAVARVVALHADWRTRVTRPGWETLGTRAGKADGDGVKTALSRATVARVLRWLRWRGWLGVVESGTTAQFRPGVLHADEGNLAAVYVLAVPHEHKRLCRPATGAVKVNDTPTRQRSCLVVTPRASARGCESKSTAESKAIRRSALTHGATLGADPPDAGALRLGMHDRPQKRADERQAADLVRGVCRPVRGASPRAVAAVCRPYWRAGWSSADIVHAVDWRPDGRAWTYEAAVKIPARWLAVRLAAWSDGPGPALSRTQRSERAKAIAAAATEQRRAELAARAAAVPGTAAAAARGAALARAMLTERSPAAAAALARAAATTGSASPTR